MKAWHFLQNNRELQWNSDGVIKPGKVYEVDPNKLEMCDYGLHASIKPLDALQYAPGSIICRVELSGKILKQKDKVCASKRKVIWMADADECLHLFACWCATEALKKELQAGRKPDKACWDAIIAKKKWIKKEISDEELSAAESAAESAAWSAAWSAAESAAWSAARSAAENAAWSAARSAARSAAENAAENKQNKKLYKMIMKLPREE